MREETAIAGGESGRAGEAQLERILVGAGGGGGGGGGRATVVIGIGDCE